MAVPLIEIKGLHVAYAGSGDQETALRGVDLKIGREKFGLVGESGSGKSTLARAVMGLLPANAEIHARRFAFDGVDLSRLSERAYRRLRGRRMGMIFQDPGSALNPVMTVGGQIAEAGRGFAAARRRAALRMLDTVHIREAQRVYESYPHQLSGGMRQRAMIAMMLMAEPDLLIADEALSSLDAGLSLEILALLDERLRCRKMGLLFISHDLDVVASFCDRVAVMREGRVVECLPAADIHRAEHPYTRALLDCIPRLGDTARRRRPLPAGAVAAGGKGT